MADNYGAASKVPVRLVWAHRRDERHGVSLGRSEFTTYEGPVGFESLAELDDKASPIDDGPGHQSGKNRIGVEEREEPIAIAEQSYEASIELVRAWLLFPDSRQRGPWGMLESVEIPLFAKRKRADVCQMAQQLPLKIHLRGWRENTKRVATLVLKLEAAHPDESGEEFFERDRVSRISRQRLVQ